MKHSFLVMILGLLSFRVLADTTNVTLHIGTVSAVRQPMIVSGVHTNSVTFSCEATFDNRTGTPLTAIGLYSVFDGMSLVVLDASDKELARQGYADHFSTFVTHSFTLPVGKTTQKLTFPFCFVPCLNQAVVVRVEGGLRDSGYTGSITSNVVDVKIHK